MSTPLQSPAHKAGELASYFAALPQVVAVALGGSQSSGAADSASDIDLYIYTEAELAPEAQAAVIEQAGGARRAELNRPYWGGMNIWIDAPSGITVDCIYWDAAWIEQQIAGVLERHQPSLGYSTSFCRTVQQARALYDPRGWYQALQARTRQPYPEQLRRNIIAHNHPVLRTLITSYRAQIASAVRRDDIVSINHRVAGLLASYFDCVFALNRVLHPGEKRLLAFAERECPLLPRAMASDIAAVLSAAGSSSAQLLALLDRLLDRLDQLLAAAGFDPRGW